jgi:hypothetical protein
VAFEEIMIMIWLNVGFILVDIIWATTVLCNYFAFLNSAVCLQTGPMSEKTLGKMQ